MQILQNWYGKRKLKRPPQLALQEMFDKTWNYSEEKYREGMVKFVATVE